MSICMEGENGIPDVCSYTFIQNFLNEIPSNICIKDGKGRIVIANNVFVEMFGLDGIDYIGKTASDFSQNAPAAFCDFFLNCQQTEEQVWQQGMKLRQEELLNIKHNKQIPLDVLRIPVFSINGKRKFMVCIGKDMTERRKMIEDLRISEERLRTVINAIPDFICFKDKHGRYLETNDLFIELLGHQEDPNFFKGKNNQEIAAILNNYLPFFYECEDTIETIWQAGKASVTEVVFPDSQAEFKTFDVRKVPLYYEDGRRKGMVVIGRDITKNKQAEKKIRESEENYRILFEQASDGIFVVNEEGKFSQVNTSLCRMFGYRKDEILNKSFDQVVSTDTLHNIEMDLALLSSNKSIVREWEVATTNGFRKFLEISIVALSNGCFQGIARDISGRKKTEEMLNKQKKQLSAILSNTPDVIARFNKQFKHVYVNPVVEKFSGKSPQEYINKSYRDLGRFEEAAFWQQKFSEVFATGTATAVEFTYNGPAGEQIFHALLVPEFDQDEKVEFVLRIARDITEQKLVKRQMARLERLNLIGEMAAGIGHEVRNPLTTVRGFLQMFQNRKAYENDKDVFNLMIDELDRANTIISEFLSLAKNKAIKLELKNLNSIVNAIFPLIQAHAMMFDVYTGIKLQPVPDLLLDEKEIRQLIFNLARNGIEAMAAGGCLIISTMVNDDGDVVLAVKDEGSGIDPVIKDKLGTPFFTTKDTGTGLGLAICFSIAARHNATISFDTGLDGTTFYTKFKNNENR